MINYANIDWVHRNFKDSHCQRPLKSFGKRSTLYKAKRNLGIKIDVDITKDEIIGGSKNWLYSGHYVCRPEAQ